MASKIVSKTKTVSVGKSKVMSDVLEQLRRSLEDMKAGRVRNAEY